ncbi:alkyl hydroperoxide reductase subunit C [Haploplasma axanthum]|uniref:Alkyl hydroperoxide reductase C n=1 Tax=Haploplasma axanthum TaxID=29552 RepID=A0A449BFA2_HAPAX|nr:alkyl hydroperoxide reductase subunit C [Haploplasma axanthum]VEU80990.1 Alkyl hydroperoxide reductase subunit C [Haploplasma axanthum]
MSLIGKKVSPFSVQAYHDNAFIEIANKDLEGKWNAIVFYPADFSFVCPTELEDLANHYDEFKKLGCEVYSVSTDTHFVHKAWHDASSKIKKIKFPMLADPAGKLAKDFEVLVEENWQALRGSFIVNPEGVIVAYEVNDMGIGRSASDLVRKLQAAQFVAKHGDEVCPANWNPGEETLKPGIDLVGKL